MHVLYCIFGYIYILFVTFLFSYYFIISFSNSISVFVFEVVDTLGLVRGRGLLLEGREI